MLNLKNWEYDLRRLQKQNNSFFNNTGILSWCCYAFLLLIALGFASPQLHAADPSRESNSTLVEYLVQEKLNFSYAIKNEKQQTPPKDEKEYNLKKKKLSVIQGMNNAKIQSLEGFLDNQDKQRIHLAQRLKYLQQLPLGTDGINIQEKVAKVESLIIINKKTIDLINDNLSLATQYQIALREEEKALENWYAKYALEQKLIEIKKEKSKLNKRLHDLYSKNIKIQNKSNVESKKQSNIEPEIRLLISNQEISLIHQRINALNLYKKIVISRIGLLKSVDAKSLQYVTDVYKDAINQLGSMEDSLGKINSFVNNEKILAGHSELNQLIKSLQHNLKIELRLIGQQKQLFNVELVEYQNQLKKLISSRQTLAEYSVDSWPFIIHKVVAIPSLFYKYLKALTLKVYDSYLWLDMISMVLLWLTITVIAISYFFLNRFLKTLSSNTERYRLTGYLYDGALTLIQRNIPYLCIINTVWVIFYFTNISYANYQLLFNLIGVWFAFKALILVARLVLLERISDSSGKDVKLYYRLKWLFLFGAWATALMMFSHLLPLPILLQDLFNRLFMLFLLTISLVAWKSKDVIPYLIRPFLMGKKRYFKNAISVLAVLIPITLLTTALIGLAGFINLSWTMSRYQADVLIVLVGYILARGLLSDALELCSEWMISSLNNGWLWIEVFLKPMDKILRIVVLLASVLCLFQLYGWNSDSMVMLTIEKFAQYTIINIPGIHVTVASTVEFFIVLAVFVWASKWTREFCYRWLYKEAKDVGIRNSLAVFTQYAVILLGGFITLRVLGLDFSGMSMILGGLAVGMGFGLRDFASNIVGGIMLLIERPVREGDLISIGEYEGQVSHIGIRSMRVSSWDNTEVLIPNAETFNKPFTNWTHQDGIVRTVIPIKVSRSDDPVMIQQLILDVLAIIPEIVPDPPAQVFLKKIDEALIEFEVRYFINVQIHSRVEIRSKVLFAITAQFKAAGIKPPIEPITVEFKEGHGDFLKTNKTTEE